MLRQARQLSRLSRLGCALFRYRALIGVVAFAGVYVVSRPTPGTLSAGMAPVVAGLAFRVWAAGYIGRAGRTRALTPLRLVRSGPFRYLRNPLYVGNFLLVLGVLVVLNPAWWLQLPVLGLFILEYALIVRAEEAVLAKVFGHEYSDYRRAVRALVPGRTQSGSKDQVRFSWARARYEGVTLAALAAACGLAWLRMRY